MRAVALHSSRFPGSRPIPDLLVRDLLIVVLLTDGDERTSARGRLDQALGPELTDRLLSDLRNSDAPLE